MFGEMVRVAALAKDIVSESGSHAPTVLVFKDSDMEIIELSLPRSVAWEKRQNLFKDTVDRVRSLNPDFFIFVGALHQQHKEDSMLLIYGKEYHHSVSIIILYEIVNGRAVFHEPEILDSNKGELTVGVLDAVFEPLN